ncbi:MAG: beta-ketoacyl synthase N-terminal-like domain-containing protein [Bacteroidales bacterium]|jgi:3-oxoacyl-[acyl-carrier-protein] synthase-1
MMRKVFIAGDNIVNSLGFSTVEVMNQLETGATGFKFYNDPRLAQTTVPLSLVDQGMLHSRFKDILQKRHPELDEKSFTRLEKMFIVSIDGALKGIESDIYTSNSLLIISSTKGNIDLLEEGKKEFPDPKRIFLWKMADVIGSFFGFVNRPMVVSNACISGVLALTIAARMIKTGLYENIIVSGGDLLSEFVISGFLSFQALSPEPCKPFDIARNGLSLGEGCGTMVLSSKYKKAMTITASGSAVTNDANHISGPSRTGEELAMAITKALKEANIDPGNLDFISAHGTATLYNDEMESKAIGIAGLQTVQVNSLKGYWGHTLGAAGVIESVATIHSMENNILFRSAGFDESGVPVALNVIRKNTNTQVKNSLKIASGFGGCNAAMVFQKI